MKIDKKYLVIIGFALLITSFVLFTQDRKSSSNTFKNEIEINKQNKRLLDELSIKKIENDLFQISYVLPYSNEKNKISEKVRVNFNNLSAVSTENKQYTFRNTSCDFDRKKYILLLDISGSVKESIGENKYITEINRNLMNIFENTRLTVGDEIYVGFIGENLDRGIVYEFTGPIFEGIKTTNNVYKKNTFKVNNVIFSKDVTKDIAKCGIDKNIIANSINQILADIEVDFKDKIERNTKLNTFIGESIKSIKPHVQSDKYSKIIYIIFSDGGDVSAGYGKDTSFQYCNYPTCGYSFLKQSDEDEAYVFWSDKASEEKFKLLFDGIKLNLN